MPIPTRLAKSDILGSILISKAALQKNNSEHPDER
jgi:hypothetical protein